MKKYFFLVSTILLGGIVFIFVFLKKDSDPDEVTNSIFINEIMSANTETIVDEYGDYTDWIELYNASDEDINIGKYYLTDREDNLVKWRFTKDIMIPSNGYLLVFASGKNEINNDRHIHTNFKVSAEGETILLVAPNGKTIIDSIQLTRMGTDISVGRMPDGSTTLKTFNAPTPDESNLVSQEFPEAPKFSKSRGFYKEEFLLNIDAEPETDIYYTLDGSVPTEESLLYTEPIHIRSRIGDGNELSSLKTSSSHWLAPPKEEVFRGTVVKAIAMKEGKKSDLITNTYFVDESIDERYDIPIVSISMNKDHLFDENTGLFVNENYLNRGKEWERAGYIEFFDENKQVGFAQKIGFRIHGNYSRNWPNPPLRVYARGEEGYFNYQLFDDKPIDSFNTFLLRNGGSAYDRATFRDALLQSLVKDIGHVDIQYSKPSILFINGEYWGVYNIRDRFDDYYVYNHYGTMDIDMISDRLEADVGSTKDYEKLLQLLQKDLNLGSNYEYVKDQIDIINFADYHIAQIFYMNIDQPWRNIKMWKVNEPFESEHEETDGKWRWLLYDTEQSFSYSDFAHYDRDGLVFSTNLDYFGAPTINEQSEWPTYAANRPIATLPLRSLLNSDEFRYYFINRFADLMNTTFRTDHVINKIEEMRQLYSPYMEEHINRWGRPYSVESWSQDVDRMVVFAKERPSYMTQDIVNFFGLTGTYELSITDHFSRGTIKLNTLKIDQPYTGTYFNDVPIELVAQPKEGYRFVKWVSNDEKLDGSTDSTLSVSLNKDTTIKALYEIGEEPETGLSESEGDISSMFPLMITTTIITGFLIGYVIARRTKN